MKSLSQIPNTDLLHNTRTLAGEERRIGIEILHHLREIRRRHLHLELGYSSLFLFCVTELKYSEASAYRKLQALKLMDEVPETEEKLKSGALTLSTAAQVQTFAQSARKQGLSIPPTAELVARVENKSRRETEKLFAEFSPEPIRHDRIRPLTETHSEIRFTASARLLQKLEKIKDLRSHVNPGPTMAELIEDLADLVLARMDPERRLQAKTKPVQSAPSVPPPALELSPAKVQHVPHPRRAAIPRALKQAIWVRDRGRCTYKDSATGRICESRHQLQLDHRTPWAKGGADSLENLRLRCRTHNIHTAILNYGENKIDRYLNSQNRIKT